MALSTVLVLTVCALSLAAKKNPVTPSPSPSPSPPSSSFDKWKKTFGKSYPSEAEEAISSANYDKASALIDAHNTQPLAFRLAHNQFSDMSPAQVCMGAFACAHARAHASTCSARSLTLMFPSAVPRRRPDAAAAFAPFDSFATPC
jgi:hypothetical protein